MVADTLSDAETRMQKATEALNRELATVRTGRATSGLVENLMVEYYGTLTPLNQLATISVPEARLIMVQPWDRQVLSAIEKAVLKANLGLNPTNDGSVIRLPIPQPTEERRRELAKIVKGRLEEARVEVRNIRREMIDRLRTMERNKELSQDESQRTQDRHQQITDAFIALMDSAAAAKEKEVMEV